VTLVDLDKAMTDLFKANKTLTRLNEDALSSPKVEVINADAFVWIREQKDVVYDFIAVDFPDPSNYSLGKLYTTSFYIELQRVLSNNGCAVVQSTSPYVARQSFWIIDTTLRKTGLKTEPYHCYVPSFGEWGFILAFKERLPETMNLPAGRKFIDEQTVNQMFVFPPDMSTIPSEANTLNNQVLVNTFEKEWAHYIR
jgi:spermidine synthase